MHQKQGKRREELYDTLHLGNHSDPFLSLVHAGTWTWNLDTNENTWSEELWTFYGLDPKHTVPGYDAWREAVLPEDRVGVESVIGEAVAKNGEFNIAWRVNGLKDGEVRWLMSRGHPVSWCQEGRTVMYAGIVLDITQWAQSERLATAKEVYETIPGTFSIMDAEGGLIAWNRAMREEFSGMSEEEMCGIDGFGLIHPEDRGLAQELGIAILTGDVELSGEARVLIQGGPDYVWRRISGRRVQIDGRPCVMAIGVDISDRKRFESFMEFHLKLSRLSETATVEELLRATLDEAERMTGSSIGFCHLLPDVFSPDPIRICSTNTQQPGCRMVGKQCGMAQASTELWTEVALASKSVIQNNGFSFPVGNCLPGEHSITQRYLVVPHVSKDKVRGIFCVANKPLDYSQRDADLVEQLVMLAWDIIARKHMEETERVMQEQLHKSQNIKLVGQLAGGIAHDYNNMLAITLGNVELLLAQVTKSHPFFESLQAILSSTERSATITNQLLAFARKQTIQPECIDLNAVIEAFLPMLKGCSGEAISWLWRPSREKLAIIIDHGQMEQVLLNLCINARDAMVGARGTITIETQKFFSNKTGCPICGARMSRGYHARLSFTDTGRGIAENHLPHIFEPFFTTKDVGKGSGMGLSSVYGIVKQHGGHIHCDSRPGKGATFIISVPLDTLPAGQEDSLEGDASVDMLVERAKKTVLVVEDEPELLHIVKTILENNNYRVHTAADGETAIAMHDQHFDLLITDVILTGMNGIELCDRMRRLNPGLLCLFMSGHAPSALDRNQVLLEGVNFLNKPFGLKDLMAMVGNLFDGNQHSDEVRSTEF